MERRGKYRLIGIFAVVLVALLFSAAAVFSQGGTWSTAISVQNLGGQQGDVTVEFRNTPGTLTNALTRTIAAGANYTFDQRYASGDPGTDPFAGSAIVSSNQPMAAVANIMRTGGTAPSYESYSGLSDADVGTTFALPQLLKNVSSAGVAWNTTIDIQNTNTSSAISVTVVFIPSPGNNPAVYTVTVPFTKTISLGAGAAYRMNQATEPTDAQIGNKFFGSGRILASGSVAVIVVSDGGDQVLLAYPSYASGTTSPIGLPSMYKNIMSLGNSYSTAALVVNMGSSEAQVRIQYIPTGVGTVSGTDTFTVPANGSRNLDQRYNAPSITSPTFMGGAVLTSTNGVPIAAMVNLRGGSRYGMTYGGLMDSGNTIYMPISYKTISSAGYSWSSTVIVQNFEGGTANVNFTFYPSAGAPITDTTTYTVTTVRQFDLRYTTAISSQPTFIGSVKVVSDKLVGTLVQTRGAGGSSGDALMAFQGMAP